tara:strand:- start:3 stop:1265 length:1263 start_codon:yes stop_codon:yes gene_type:complete
MDIVHKFGLYALYLLMSIVPFHFSVSEYSEMTLYREYFFLFFLFLFLLTLIEREHVTLTIRPEIFFLMLSIFCLALSALYDPMIDLYRFSWDWQITSKSAAGIDPRLFVLRAAVIYVPMIFYFSLRGLKENEIKNIAFISVIVAPFSLLVYLMSVFDGSIFSIFLLGQMAEYGGANIAYNSYVPYMTFPVISGIYLISIKTNNLMRAITIFSLSLILIFIFLSSSRQSLLLIGIAALFFIFLLNSGKLKILLTYAFFSLLVYFLFLYVTYDFDLNQNLINKYTEGETSRFQIFINGLNLLRPHEYITGTGLSSVMNSGPHNDFLRWTQRVGIIFMIFSFMPYFLSLLRINNFLSKTDEKPILIYLGLVIFFTIYHSLFGYPREDAFQAIWCFLGLAMWLGFEREKNPKFRNIKQNIIIQR